MKKILAIVSIIAMSLTISTTAFAKSRTATVDSVSSATTSSTSSTTKTTYSLANEKWLALTDAQKAEIYALMNNSYNIDIQIINKYLEWGVIDETTATDLKTKLTERNTTIRESGNIPVVGGRGGRGKR